MEPENTPLSEQPFKQNKGKKVSGIKKLGRTFFLLLLIAGIFCIYWFFFNSYSKGERTGVLIKITHKGNVFKTDEGEMWLSCRQMTNPEKFYFSVTNDSITNILKNLQDECVQLTYTQYRAVLAWRGDTKYVVNGVIPIKKN
ncbi:MAG: 6-phosphogluconate dehydrogenase [Bacteroidota bacterium]